MFCTQITKMSDFRGLTCKDKRSRDLVTVAPIFNKKKFKLRKARKKKFSERRGAIHMRSRAIRKIVEGGGGHNAPGLIRVKMQALGLVSHSSQ